MVIGSLFEKCNREEIEIVSFDIFDTLIFRLCHEPTEIFGKMFRKNKELFPDDFVEEDWINLRKTVELQIRHQKYEKYGNYEVELSEIYNHLPAIITQPIELMKLECEKEISSCYLNIDIYETIKDLFEHGKRILLISDMYLPKQIIIRILTNCGVDIKYFTDIYISCDYKESKRNKSLFRRIITEYDVQPGQVCHIGDNSESDIASAKQVGFDTYHYNLISEAKIKYPYLELEKMAFHFSDVETYSLRVITAAKKDNFWYKTGAMIMGPMLSYFSMWISKIAEKEEIRVVRPMMREGDFLSKMIENASNYIGYLLDIKPLYVSRFALYKVLFNEITIKEIEYMFSTNGMVLEELFRIFKIEDYIDEFKEYKHKNIIELKCIDCGKCSVYDSVFNWLTSEEIIRLIRKRNNDSASNIIQYFNQMGMIDNKAITVDIGWRGSIQNAIDKLYRNESIHNRLKHIVCVAKPDVARNMYPNTNIYGFIGKCGGEYDITNQLMARLYEMFLMSEKGTTIDYAEDKGHIVPITKKIDYSERQVESMKQLQEGIIDFQLKHMKYIYDMSIEEIKKKAIESLAICERLMRFPTKNEVSYLKDLEYDQNFGANSFTTIIDQDSIAEFCSMSEREYDGKMHNANIMWKSGLYSLRDPLYYYRLLYRTNLKFASLGYVISIEEAIKRAKTSKKRVTLVGAGDNLKLFLCLISAMDEMDIIEAIVDNDVNKKGAEYNGIIVNRLDNINSESVFLCTIRSKAAFTSLKKQIEGLIGHTIVMYGFGRE